MTHEQDSRPIRDQIQRLFEALIDIPFRKRRRNGVYGIVELETNGLVHRRRRRLSAGVTRRASSL